MKYGKYSPAKFVNFVHICITGGGGFSMGQFSQQFQLKNGNFSART